MKVDIMGIDPFAAFKDQKDENGNSIAIDPQIVLIENLDKRMKESFKLSDSRLKALETGFKIIPNDISKSQDKIFKLMTNLFCNYQLF
jgi:hypothetical protein